MSKKRTLKSVVSVIVVLTMVFVMAACTPTTPTASSAVSASVVVAPSESTVASSSAPTTESPFSEVKIVWIGGTAGDSFSQGMYNGAKLAQEELGCDVQYLWSNWDNNTMINQLKESIALEPNAIVIMGHPGDDAYKAVVDEAESKGIVITAQNTPLPALEAIYKTKGFGYVGQQLYPAGVMLATEALKRSGLVAGDKAMVWGMASQPGRGERTKGAVDALTQAGIKVDYIEMSAAVVADGTQGTPVITSYLAANPDCKMIISDGGTQTSTMPVHLKAAGKNPGDVYVAGFDISGATATAIKDGWVGCTLDQQQWLQGYLSIIQCCISVKYGFSGLNIDTGAAIIDKNNVDFVLGLAAQGIR